MSAPGTTTRLQPTGIKLDDGYSTRVAFSRNADINFWEKTVQPVGMDGGDPIDTTTMLNERWRTMASRQLITLTQMQMTCAYDPICYQEILDTLLNQEGAVTCLYPDGSTISYYGYLKSFEPQTHSEGSQPEANVTIVPTNKDPVTGEEEDPVMTLVAGT